MVCCHLSQLVPCSTNICSFESNWTRRRMLRLASLKCVRRLCRAAYCCGYISRYCVLCNAIRSARNILPHLLTPWCRVLLEKLTGLQLAKKFPAFHGTQRLIIALTSVRHPSLSWASPIQPIYPHPTSWRSILILSTHLRLGLPSSLFPSGVSHSLLLRMRNITDKVVEISNTNFMFNHFCFPKIVPFMR